MAHYTFKQFQAEYPDDAACLDKVLEMRYGGNEFECPKCMENSRFHRISKRRAYACQKCGHHVFPCVGTPFEKSRTPLTTWFFAMYLMTSTRNGVAAKELERQIGCTYKTAWRMAHELRKLMAQADDHEPLSGHVEVDEVFVGGKSKGRVGTRKGMGRATNKPVVMGIIERGGSVVAGPIRTPSGKILTDAIKANVQRGSTISTDKWPGYGGLNKAGYQHGAVNHSKGEYVRGIHHVNSIENFWRQLTRGINGTHIHVSKKHLWKYVSEFSFRFNMRKQPEAMFARLVWAFSQPRLADS